MGLLKDIRRGCRNGEVLLDVGDSALFRAGKLEEVEFLGERFLGDSFLGDKLFLGEKFLGGRGSVRTVVGLPFTVAGAGAGTVTSSDS